MFRATVKALTARKLRLMMSALAVVLGVAFVVGAFVLTDSLGRTFTDLFSSVNKNIAVDVRGTEITPGSGNSDGGGRHDVPASTIATVQRRRRRRRGAGQRRQRPVQPGQRARQGRQGAVHQRRADHRRQLDRLRQAQPAAGGRRHRAARTHRGRARRPAGREGRRDASATRPPCSCRPGSSGSRSSAWSSTRTARTASAASRTSTSPPRRRRSCCTSNGYSDLRRRGATTGCPRTSCASRIAAALPSSTEAITGKQLADEQASDIQQGLSFLNTFLLVFAGGRAVRRGVHHLQHVLDPGRPADQGAGPDAGARRLQGAGDPVGAAGGRRGRRDRVGHRARCRCRRRRSGCRRCSARSVPGCRRRAR